AELENDGPMGKRTAARMRSGELIVKDKSEYSGVWPANTFGVHENGNTVYVDRALPLSSVCGTVVHEDTHVLDNSPYDTPEEQLREELRAYDAEYQYYNGTPMPDWKRDDRIDSIIHD